MKKLIAFLVGLLTLACMSAWAHLTYPSEIRLDLSSHQAFMEIRIPVDELLLSLPENLSKKNLADLVNTKSELVAYLDSHIKAYKNSPSIPLSFTINSLSLVDTQQGKRLLATAMITQPNGGALGNFSLHYNVVSHQVINHKSLVTLNSDFDGGQLTADAQPFGSFDYQHEELSISRSQGSWLKGMLSFIKLGLVHIDAGLDHLAFIVCLLLLAPLQLINNKWRLAHNRDAIVKALKLVSMFTLGHTATLVLVSLQIVTPDAKIIEIMICITIILTALHAIKPLRYFHETLATFLFGLIHGAAFSETLQHLHFSRGDFALSLAGFNLGIEIAQLIAIGLLFPWLLIIRRKLPYLFIKNAMGFLLLCVASFWLYERIAAQPQAIVTVSGLQLYLGWLPFMLGGLAAACLLSHVKKVRPLSTPQ